MSASSAAPPSLDALYNGHRFILYKPDNASLAVHLFYRPDPTGASTGSFQLSTNLANPLNSPESTATIPLSTLTDVFLGKQTPLFAATSADTHCFTLVTETSQWDLESDGADERIVETWMDGIALILSAAGKTVTIDSDELADVKESRSLCERTSAGRRMSVRNAPPPPPPQSAVDVLKSGHNFTRYMTPTYTTKVAIHYEAADATAADAATDMGAFIITSQGTGHTDTVPLTALTDVFLGKQTALLEAAVDAIDGNCFTLVTDEAEWDLEADTAAVVELWLEGIHDVLSSAGKEVTMDAEELEEANGEEQQTLNESGDDSGRRYLVETTAQPVSQQTQPEVQPPAPLSVAVAASVPAPAPVSLAAPVAAASVPTTATPTQAPTLPKSVPKAVSIKVSLLNGYNCFVYTLRAGTVVRSHQTLFVYDYTLYWCDTHVRERSTAASIPLRTIRDIYCGRSTDILKSSVAMIAKDDCCLSIVTKTSQLNVECATAQDVMNVVEELMTLLKAAGKRVQEQNVAAKPKAKAPQENENATATPISAPETNKAGPGLPPRPISELVAAQATTASAQATASTPVPVQSKPASAQSGASRRISIMPTKQTRLPATAQQLAIDTANRRATLLGVSPALAVQSMIEGRRFIVYTMSAKSECSVFYVQAEHTLYWSQPGSRIRHDAHRVQLNQLKEVVLGKNTAVFHGPNANASDRAKCVSLIDIHSCIGFEAETTEQMSAWLFGLQSLLTSNGRSVVVEKTEKAKGKDEKTSEVDEKESAVAASKPNRNRFSIVNSNAADVSSSKSAFLDIATDDHLALLAEGRVFDDYGSGDRMRSIKLFYAQGGNNNGSFYYTNPESPPVPSYSHPLQLIHLHDIMIGNDAFPFVSRIHTDETCCFTLKFIHRIKKIKQVLHLQATSQDVRSAFLSGIALVLNMHGMNVMAEKTGTTTSAISKKKKGNSRFSILPPPSSATSYTPDETVGKFVNRRASLMNAMKDDEMIEMMIQGRRWHWYHMDEYKDVVRTQITLFYQSTDHTLYWCEVGERACIPNQSLPLKKLRAVRLGKQSPCLISPAATEAHNVHCLSLSTEAFCLELEADSSEQVSAWLVAIQSILTQSGKKVTIDKKQQKSNDELKRFSIKGFGGKGRDAVMTLSSEDNVHVLTSGHQFTMYQASKFVGGKAIHSLQHVFYDAKKATFYYCHPLTRQTIDAHSLPLSSLTDVYIGKEHGASTSVFPVQSDDSCCLSLISNGQTGHNNSSSTAIEWHIECAGVETMSAWVNALQSLFVAHRLGIDQVTTGGTKRFCIIQKSGLHLSNTTETTKPTTPAESLKLMSAANPFFQYQPTQYELNGVGGVTRTLINVRYDSVTHSLYYQNVADVTQPMLAFTLNELRQVKLGKQTPLLQSSRARAALTGRCVALIDSANNSLELEGLSVDALNHWIYALQFVLTSKGKDCVVEEKQQQSIPQTV